MKLNMETVYVPEANFVQQRDMMTHWREASEKVSKFSFVCFLLSQTLLTIIYIYDKIKGRKNARLRRFLCLRSRESAL